MKSRTLIKLAIQSIRKNKLRAALTMLGIIIGVAAVIVMVAVGFGARSRIKAQINNLGTNMIVITAGAAQQAGVSQGAQAFPNLTVDDVEKLESESALLTAVSPVIVTRTTPPPDWPSTDWAATRAWASFVCTSPARTRSRTISSAG